MALREPFLSRLLALLVCTAWCSCWPSEGDPFKGAMFNADAIALESRNGLMYRDSQPFTGKVYHLDQHGDTLFVAGFVEGREHGEWRSFYPGNVVREQRFFVGGQKAGTYRRWWPDGRMQFRCTFAGGEYEGELSEWNESGQLTKLMHYRAGYEEGSQKLFYDNGKVRSNYVVKNGRRIGLLGSKNCVNVSDSVFSK